MDGETGLFMAAPGQGREARHGGTAGLEQVGDNGHWTNQPKNTLLTADLISGPVL